MSGAERTSARGWFPGGLLGMIALAIGIEGAVSRHALDLTDPASWSWVLSGRAAQTAAPGCKVLCLGDSLVKHGVLTPVIEAETGQRAYNLSVCAALAPAQYYLFRRALEAGAKPRAVVVDYKPDLLAGGPRYAARNWPELLTWPELLDLAMATGKLGFGSEAALSRLLPSARCRFEIRAALRAALGGEDASPRGETLFLARNWALNRGAQFTPRNPEFQGRVSAEQHKRYMSHLWRCDRINQLYVRRLLTLAADRKVRVYWLLPPVAPAIQAERERTGTDTQHEEFVRALLAEFPNVVVVDGRQSGYAASVFIDPVHLDGRGAYTLSVDLAAILDRTPPPGPGTESRWLALPPYRDVPIALPLEDLARSRTITEQGGATRRR